MLCDKDGWVYVADRENHRVQVFDGNGNYETQWNNLYRPCALMLSGADTANPLCFIGEIPPSSKKRIVSIRNSVLASRSRRWMESCWRGSVTICPA